MTSRNTVVGSMHDVGAAVWLGGALLRRTGRLGRIQVFQDAGSAHRTLARERSRRSFLVEPAGEQRAG